jgi:hypothetical protein
MTNKLKHKLLNDLKQLEQRVIDSMFISDSVMYELKTIHTFINKTKEIEEYLQSNQQQKEDIYATKDQPIDIQFQNN